MFKKLAAVLGLTALCLIVLGFLPSVTAAPAAEVDASPTWTPRAPRPTSNLPKPLGLVVDAYYNQVHNSFEVLCAADLVKVEAVLETANDYRAISGDCSYGSGLSLPVQHRETVTFTVTVRRWPEVQQWAGVYRWEETLDTYIVYVAKSPVEPTPESTATPRPPRPTETSTPTPVGCPPNC